MKKKKPTVFGYVVVPSGDKEARASQMQALEEYTPDSILTDREYKTKTDRTSLTHIIEMLQPEDVVITSKLTNFGRNYGEILETWKRISEERRAYIVSLEPPVVDTRPGKQGVSQTAIEFLSCLVETEEMRSKGKSAELCGILHTRRHLAATPLFKGIPNFRQTRIAMLRAETMDELLAILEDIRKNLFT